MSGILNVLMASGAGNSFTLVAGTTGSPGLIGYISGSIGSLSPSSAAGKTIGELVDSTSTGDATFTLTGLASDPTQSWLTSIKANGVTLTGASATYSYSGGTATWTWGSGFSLSSGSTYPVTILYV